MIIASSPCMLSACKTQNQLGVLRKLNVTRTYATRPWFGDSSELFLVDSLLSALDGVDIRRNEPMRDLHREFQALCADGKVQTAMDVLCEMESRGQFPCERDYICFLKACSKTRAISQAKRRSVHAWTAIITASVDSGNGRNAIKLYRRMQAERVECNEFMIVSLFRACSTLRNLEFGKELHAEAKRRGFLSDVFVGSTLVNMYGKCGDIQGAKDVFVKLPCRNTVSWNAMLSAYVDQGQPEKALKCHKQMKQEGLIPEEATYVIILQACAMLAEEEGMAIDGQMVKMKALMIGRGIHEELKQKGFQSHPFVSSSLINMYGKCGDIREAESVFRGLSRRDVVSWTAILAAYVVQSQGEKVLELYKEMQKDGIRPDQQTLVIALQGCCLVADKEEFSLVDGQAVKHEALKIGRNLHEEIRLRRFESNVFVASSLVMMYGKCGGIADAEHAFGRLTHVDNIAWNSMLSAYLDQGQGKKGIELFRRMLEEGACVDEVTFVCVLQACSDTGEVELCRDINFCIISVGCQLNTLFTSLTHAYGSCAQMSDARAICDTSCRPDTVLYSALIAGFCREGNSAACFEIFERMHFACIFPDQVIFLCLFSTCSHNGLVNEGLNLFNMMSANHHVQIGAKHIVSLFDLLGRAGDFKRLEGILRKLPVQTDGAVWLCLLAACRNHGNAEMGKFAFDYAVKLQPTEAGAYVLMSNICVDADMLGWAKQWDNNCRNGLGVWEEDFRLCIV
ncbi:hypothetical protein KP509_13G012100 [Ceratopteris richardii]|uniref:Pentatricopeptide repeat-containing protein n=1 Tax=Ceratopteris richardii TaxID=49495 RepID=A0A8T2TFH4_CERRI|nr:hypothetical protein KP509_13G012100 [Ceratopteris richardii]